MNARVLVLDHKDSFVFNLVDAFARRGCTVRTLRAELAEEQLERELASSDPHLVVLSPGPGHPRDAATTLAFLRSKPRVPVLGVCLGQQAMGVALGGTVARAPEPVHGRATPLRTSDDPLFAGLPQPFLAARYHSLVIEEMPAELHAIAVTDDAEALPMAVRHRELPWLGLQFHPESVLCPWGDVLLGRALDAALEHAAR